MWQVRSTTHLYMFAEEHCCAHSHLAAKDFSDSMLSLSVGREPAHVVTTTGVKCYLQASFTGTSPLCKDINDEPNPVEHRNTNSQLQVTLLHWSQSSINKNFGWITFCAGILNGLDYAWTKICRWRDAVVLCRACCDVWALRACMIQVLSTTTAP